MFEKKDNRRRNYLILARLLALGGITILMIRRNKVGPEREVYGTIALVLIIALAIVTVLFYLKPGAFGNKSANPDEQAD